MAIFKQHISNFSGGLLEDKRISSPSHFSITKHFDTLTYPMKLVPYPKTVTSLGLSGAPVTDLKLVKFLYAQNQSATTFRLYGLGVPSGSNKVKLYRFDIDGAIDLDTANWLACANGESSVGARSENMLFYYKANIYTFSGTTALNKFDTLESSGWTDGCQTLGTTTNPIQPVLHPSDDCAYFFSDNIVYRLNNGSWEGAVLTLPSTYRITAACADGNYLSIGCTTLGTLDVRSIVFKWDRDSSLTTLTERVDFGEGALAHLWSANNKLLGAMGLYLNNAYALGRGYILIKQANGQIAQILNTLTTDTAQVSSLPATRFQRNDKVYFPMKATLNGDTRLGIWVVDSNGKAALDFVESSATSYDGIYLTANIWWIAHSANGSVTRSDKNGAYSLSNPSTYESLLLNTIHVTNRGVAIGNSATTKKLRGITVLTEPLPSGASVIVKYRRNFTDQNNHVTESSWTTIGTHNTQNSVMQDFVNTAAGDNLPYYNEIQFQFQSLGGAAVTGFEYSGETVENAPFE